ncbi:hypothetical protein KM043_017795 [Ampulex compressa]|nr:hypothetical protein KM043_017795 [Ampulex compressa]
MSTIGIITIKQRDYQGDLCFASWPIAPAVMAHVVPGETRRKVLLPKSEHEVHLAISRESTPSTSME